ncbi:hypothetical protein J2T12_005500 [Paenibacillus anaericanus]|nr:hypothetical protein [Paenibacillus anaericanus]MDQ0092056.1 hypothetical protein [Paenibacillus anaericanus]
MASDEITFTLQGYRRSVVVCHATRHYDDSKHCAGAIGNIGNRIEPNEAG